MTEVHMPGRLAREKYTSMSDSSTQFSLPLIVPFQKAHKKCNGNHGKYASTRKVEKKGVIVNKSSNTTNQSYGYQEKKKPFQKVDCFLCRHWSKNLSQFIDEPLTLILSYFYSAYKLASRITNTGTRSALQSLQARRFAYGSL